MHMSMHNWMRSEPLDVTLARLARFGYESIEIKGEPDQYDTKTVRDSSTTIASGAGAPSPSPSPSATCARATRPSVRRACSTSRTA